MSKLKRFATILLVVLFLGCSALTSQGVTYAPSIGITSVPSPAALPKGAGDVTFKYAVKNFSEGVPLSNIQVTDNKCTPIKFMEGDDNTDSKLDFTETWRFECKTKIFATSQNIAKVTGTYGNVTVSHKAYSTVVVGSYAPPPIVSIVNVSKVAFPYSLPVGGGDVVFIYRVNNPGDVALNNVTISDDVCDNISNKLGDTNNNGLLDVTEVWLYTCATHIEKTTTNTAYVSSSANDLIAIGEATFTIQVDAAPAKNIAAKSKDDQNLPNLPSTGSSSYPLGGLFNRAGLGAILVGVLIALGIFSLVKFRKRLKKIVAKIHT